MKCSLLVLSSYLDGELEARRQGELEAHLVGCQRCRAGLGYLREEVERVSALGRVTVADHSVHALLAQLGLIEEGAHLPERDTALAVADPPPPTWLDEPAPIWTDNPRMPSRAAIDEDSVDMTGSPQRRPAPATQWDPPDLAASMPHMPPMPVPMPYMPMPVPMPPPIADVPESMPFAPMPPPVADMPPSVPDAPAPPIADMPPAMPPSHFPAMESSHDAAPDPEPDPSLADPDSHEPAAHTPAPLHAVPPASPPAAAAPPPTAARQWPPPTPFTASAPPAPTSTGAFPPGGPEPSELPDHVTASGGDAEMTASPPWTPREAPPAPTYPLTDEDVLDEPVPVERFGPPQQARPSFFERVRDRLAVRRALSRSAADDDAVQIVSGTGAPLRTGSTRGEVGRRRHDARMEPGAGARDDAERADPGDEVDLGPLPPTSPFVSPGGNPMPRPGQLSLPGSEDAPGHPVLGTPLPRGDMPPRAEPIPSLTARPLPPLPARPNAPIPPPRHTLDSALGDADPPLRPPGMPPSPTPDPLAEALSDFERDRAARMPSTEPRPWRPREIPEDAEPEPAAAAPSRRFGRAAAAIGRHSPSQLRESRRLLILFGAATLVMLLVGIISGRTTTPLPNNTTARSSSPAAPAQQPAASQPAARASAAAPQPSAAAPQQSTAPKPPAAAGAPALNGAKVLGDGGTGYQIGGFRYGQHPNDFRIVLDMAAAGTATGTPKATIGFLDPTTMYVVLESVVPSGSTGALPNTSTVTGVTLLQPSPFPNAITYQIKLAHAVQFTAGYMAGPLRLVLDLAG